MRQVKVNEMNYKVLTQLAKANKKNVESYLGDLIANAFMGHK